MVRNTHSGDVSTYEVELAALKRNSIETSKNAESTKKEASSASSKVDNASKLHTKIEKFTTLAFLSKLEEQVKQLENNQ